MCCKDCKQIESFNNSFSEGIPYTEEVYDNYIIRTFEPDITEYYLKWHYDEEDRQITVLNENDWQFQFDNQLPIKIDGTFKIKRGIYHRLIKGTSKLILKIEKL